MLSTVSLKVIQEMNIVSEIDVTRATQVQPFGENTSTIQTSGTIILKTLCGDFVIQHEYHVVNSNEDMLLGLDILPKVGISIAGVPVAFPEDQKRRYEDREESSRDEAFTQDRPKPWVVQDRIAQNELDDLMDGIDDLLVNNSELDPTVSACQNIPEATLRLPMKTSAACYRRQYPVAQSLMEVGDCQIEEWEKMSFICDAPANSRHNTPLVPNLESDSNTSECKTSTRAATSSVAITSESKMGNGFSTYQSTFGRR